MTFILQPLETERLKPKNHQIQRDLGIVNVCQHYSCACAWCDMMPDACFGWKWLIIQMATQGFPQHLVQIFALPPFPDVSPPRYVPYVAVLARFRTPVLCAFWWLRKLKPCSAALLPFALPASSWVLAPWHRTWGRAWTWNVFPPQFAPALSAPSWIPPRSRGVAPGRSLGNRLWEGHASKPLPLCLAWLLPSSSAWRLDLDATAKIPRVVPHPTMLLHLSSRLLLIHAYSVKLCAAKANDLETLEVRTSPRLKICLHAEGLHNPSLKMIKCQEWYQNAMLPTAQEAVVIFCLLPFLLQYFFAAWQDCLRTH